LRASGRAYWRPTSCTKPTPSKPHVAADDLAEVAEDLEALEGHRATPVSFV
jgi:hypothetical protein